MNTADFVVIANVLVLLPALLIRQKRVRSICVVLSFSMLFVMHLMDLILSNSLIIGVIAGSAIQPLLADSFLVPRTLRYEKSESKIKETPWWMVLLWGIAVTQLVYVWFRIEEMTNLHPLSYALFIVGGWLYFLVFELVVNNWSKWWTRHHCYQLFNVAIYAMIAEALTVAAIPVTSQLFLNLQEVILRTSAAVISGLIYGCFVAAAFTVLCAIECYRRRQTANC